MAGGMLSPRQKMINMMYLVLTAMLALNVSAEVLDAFVIIDKSIEHNTRIVSEKNNSNLSDFRRAAAENREKVEPWLMKGEDVHRRAAALYDMINQIKLDLVISGDGKNSEGIVNGEVDAELIGSLSDTDASSRILVGQRTSKGKASMLRKAMNEYCDHLLSLVDEAKSPVLFNSLIEMLRLPETQKKTDGDVTSWEVAVFDGMPLISAVALLSKYQMDVYNSESEVVSYLMRQVSATDFKFSDIDIAVIPSSNYVIQGTEFSAEMFLAAYDPTQSPVLTMGSRTYHANDKGKIVFKTVPEHIGPVSLHGNIEFIGPEGKTTRPVNLSYMVVEPNTVVSPTKMNVVYRGIENPISISSAGIPQDKLDVRITNGTIEHKGNEFIVVPGNGRICEVSVFVNGKNMGTRQLRVKDLPTPAPQLDVVSGKTATKNELLASQGILAVMPRDFDFDLRFRVVSFSVFAVDANGYVMEEESKSETFAPRQKQMFNRLRPGQRVTFTDIKAVGPDGKTIELSDLSIKLK
ncbi:MAG: gliding motility protein GldM [Prevotellaceae bacterium]|jgi:gliding motility-associated protein GldM|nr:gliding motility protein GldM [Prevotellaceae bacterium]